MHSSSSLFLFFASSLYLTEENQRVDVQNGQPDFQFHGRPREIGSVIRNLNGRYKLMLSHPSRPNHMLKYASEIEGHMTDYGFQRIRQTGVEIVRYTYTHESAAERATRITPQLPEDRIDGLHSYTYYSFLSALNARLHRANVDDVFTLCRVPLDRGDDQCLWMEARTEEMRFIYRRGTLSMEDYLMFTPEE